MRLRRAPFLALLFSSLLGCNTIVIEIAKGPTASEPVDNRKSYWFFGSSSKDVDLRAICPGGTARIVEETTFLDGLYGNLTLGIYTPRSSSYWCLTP